MRTAAISACYNGTRPRADDSVCRSLRNVICREKRWVSHGEDQGGGQIDGFAHTGEGPRVRKNAMTGRFTPPGAQQQSTTHKLPYITTTTTHTAQRIRTERQQPQQATVMFAAQLLLYWYVAYAIQLEKKEGSAVVT